MSPRQHTTQHIGWMLLTLVAVVTVLNVAEDVLMPVALAILFTFLLAPLASRLERWGCSRGVSVALTTAVAFTIVGALIYAVAAQFLGFVEDLPLYRDNLESKFRALSGSVGLERSAEVVKELTEEFMNGTAATPPAPDVARVQVIEPPPTALQLFREYVGPLVSLAATAGVAVVFVIFMLWQREDLRDRVVRLLGPREMHTTVLALDDAAQRVSRYLLMQTLINTIQGSVVAAGLYLIGVPDAILWGGLTIVLRFIPYLGPVLAAAGPIAVSIAVFDGWGGPLATLALVLTLELISNNLLEPRLYGASVGVSAFALIVATVFWTWLWGVPGLFLATPLTVCLVVMGKYIPRLEFMSVLLSDQPVLAPHERFYQRLLAEDAEEAAEVLDDAIETEPLATVYDTLVFPALRAVEHDHDRGAIDAAKRLSIIDCIGELVLAVHDAGAAEPAPIAHRVPLLVLWLPAADRADELAARMMIDPLTRAGIDARAVSATALKAEMLDVVEAERPDAICISAMPPAAVLHARYLCKRLRTRFPGVPILVGLWDARGDLRKATDRLTSAGANEVVTTASAAIEQIGRLLQPAIQGVRAEAADAPVEQSAA